MRVSKYDLYSIYKSIDLGCLSIGVDVGTITLNKANRDFALNTKEMTEIIHNGVINTLDLKPGTQSAEDALQALRMLNDTIRYNLDGRLRVVALMLNEWLPKRPDYRNSPRPSLNPSVTGSAPLFEDSILHLLGRESVDYISYLVRMSTNSDDFSAKLPINDYKAVFQDLESISTLWQLDPVEHRPEMLYCRLLAEVNEQGVPVQMANATDDKTLVMREVIPVVHAIARYRRASQSPFYKFINMMPSLLVECISAYASSMNSVETEMLGDMLNDVIAFNTALKNNSEAANQFLSRFHHGHPLYTEMIQVLREQHTLMMTTGSDLMRRFGMIVKLITECAPSEPPIRSLDVFLKETRIDALYRQQQNITVKS